MRSVEWLRLTLTFNKTNMVNMTESKAPHSDIQAFASKLGLSSGPSSIPLDATTSLPIMTEGEGEGGEEIRLSFSPVTLICGSSSGDMGPGTLHITTRQGGGDLCMQKSRAKEKSP